MAKFPTGADAILASAEAAKGGGKKFSPELFWRDGDERYIQFITPLNQIPTVPAYNVRVGTSKVTGKAIMRTLIDPRPVEGKDAYNPLADRFELQPKDKQIAVAVELEAVYEKVEGRKKRTGFKVSTRTFTYQKGDRAGEEVTVPNVGVIVNTHLFFKYLTTWDEDKGDIRETPFKVVRVGGDKNTTYSFIPYEGEAVELTDEVLSEVSLDSVIDMYMSADRYHELIDPLPDDFTPDRYAAARKAQAAKIDRTVESAEVSDEAAAAAEAASVDDEPVSDDAAAEAKLNDLRARFG